MLQTPYTALEAPPWRVSAPDAIRLGLRNLNLERGSCTPSCIRGSGAPETPDTQLRHLHLWVDGRLFSRVFGGSFGGCLAGYLTSQRWPCSVGSSSLQPQSITLTSAFQGNLMILDWTHTHTHTQVNDWLSLKTFLVCLCSCYTLFSKGPSLVSGGSDYGLFSSASAATSKVSCPSGRFIK